MEAKSFEPTDVLYSALSRTSTKQIIPSLQRPYTWDRKNIHKLWRDVLENPSPYFIGTLVFIAGEGSASRDEVIDGQQRLTTLSLILIALRDYLEDQNSKRDVGEEIKHLLLEPLFEGEPLARLEFSDSMSNAVYRQLLFSNDRTRGKSESDIKKKFLDNYEEIRKLLVTSFEHDELTPEELLERLRNLELIVITCTSKPSGYKLFESLNATAESLASVDLIKNALFMLLSADQKLLETGEESWSLLEAKFADSRSLFKSFIRHQWLSAVGYVSHSNLFEAFEKHYVREGTRREAAAYIEQLLQDADVYLALRNGEIEALKDLPSVRFDRQEIRRTLDFLRFLNVDQVYPVLLYIYKNHPKEFKKYLIRLTAFQFLFKYVPGSPSLIEKYFAKFCGLELSKHDLFESLEKICVGQKDQFSESFRAKVKYVQGRSGDVQFLLEQYLYSVGPGQSHAKPTIEHIIPQNPDAKYKKQLLRQFGDSSMLRKKVHEIGNLTILERDDNASAQHDNLPYKDKKNNYKKTNFVENKKILDFPFEDNPLEAIDERSKYLASRIYEVFLQALRTGRLVKK